MQSFGNRWRRRVRVCWLAPRNNRQLSQNDTRRPSWFKKEGADLSPLPRHQCVVFLCVFVALAGATAHGKSDTEVRLAPRHSQLAESCIRHAKIIPIPLSLWSAGLDVLEATWLHLHNFSPQRGTSMKHIFFFFFFCFLFFFFFFCCCWWLLKNAPSSPTHEGCETLWDQV